MASSRVSVVGRAPVDLEVTIDEALGERDRVLWDHGGRGVHGQPRDRDRLQGSRGDRVVDSVRSTTRGGKAKFSETGVGGTGDASKLTPFAGSTWPRRTSSLREGVDWLIFVCLGVSSPRTRAWDWDAHGLR